MLSRLSLTARWMLAAIPVLVQGTPVWAFQCGTTVLADLGAPDGDDGDYFACDLAFHGERLLVGAAHDDENGTDAGAAYLYERPPGSTGPFAFVAKLVPEDPLPYQSFGHFVALHGDTAVVGALCDDQLGSCSGAAYVFERDRGGPAGWGQTQKLVSAFGQAGDFAGRVAVGPTALLIGAPGSGDTTPSSGIVFVYERATLSSPWVEQLPIRPPDSSPGGWLGVALDLDGDLAAIGAKLDREAAHDAGAVHLYRRDACTGKWGHEAKLVASNALAGDNFGEQLAVSGDTVAVGNSSRESVYVFERDPGAQLWAEAAILAPAGLQPSDWFGSAVDLDGDVLVGGAPGRDDPQDSGRAFAFERGPGGWYETHSFAAPARLSGALFGDAVAIQGAEVAIGAPSSPIADVLPGRLVAFGGLTAPAPAVYCTAGTSQAGCLAVIAGEGFARLSQPAGFLISATSVDGQRSGIVFWGATATALPWGVGGTSWRCVQAPVVRTPLQQSGGTAGLCDGAFTLDFNAWMSAYPLAAPAAGSSVYAQTWQRDPGAPKDSTLSAGLAFTVCP